MPRIGDQAIAKVRTERGLQDAIVRSTYKRSVTLEKPDGKLVETMFPRKYWLADGTSVDTGWKASPPASHFAYQYNGDDYRVGVGRKGNTRYDSGNILTVRSSLGSSRFISAGDMYWRDSQGNRSLALAVNGAARLRIGSGNQDNFATYANAYGPGTRARFAGNAGFVDKRIHIDDLWNRMARPGPGVTRNRTWLHIPFRLSLPADVTVWAWDDTAGDFVKHDLTDGLRLVTENKLQFRDLLGETVLYEIREPWVRPDDPTQWPARALAELPPNHPRRTVTNTKIRVRIAGPVIDFEVLVRYGYLNRVSGGVLIDPTVDVDTTDGNTAGVTTGLSFSSTTNIAQIAYFSGGPYYGVALNRFISYTFDKAGGDSVDNAYASMIGFAGSDAEDVQVGFQVAANPAMPTSESEATTAFNARSTGINEGNITSSPHTSGDLGTDMDSSVTGHTAGDAIMVLWWGTSAGVSYDAFGQFQDGYESPGDTNLTFEFTAGAAGGQPAAKRRNTVPGMNQIRAGRRGN